MDMSRNVVFLVLAVLIASSVLIVAPRGAQAAPPLATGSTLSDREIKQNAGAAMADWFAARQPAGGAPGPEPTGDPGTGWILDRHFAFADHVDIAVGRTGTLWAVAGFPASFGPPGLSLFASVNGGYDWLYQGGLGGNPLDDSYGNPSIAVDVSNERIYIGFENQTTATVWIMYGDPVGGWNFHQALDSGGFGEYTPDVVVENDNGANNRVYMAYTMIPGNPASVNVDLIYSVDDGASWSFPIQVDGWQDFGSPRFQPAIAYANGFVWVVDQNNSAIDVLLTTAVEAAPPVGAWTYGNIFPPLGVSFSNPDIAVTRDGSFGAVVVEDSLGDVQSYFSADGGITWPFYAPVGISVDLEHSPSLTVDFMSSPSNAVAGRFHANWARDLGVLGSALWYGVIDTVNLFSGWSSQQISDMANSAVGTGQFVTGIVTQPRGLALTEYPVAVAISGGNTAYATTPGWTTTLDTVPSGFGFAITVDGVDCLAFAPCTYSWPADTDHSVFTASPQLTNPMIDQWAFWYWSRLLPSLAQGYTLTAPAAGDYIDYAWFVHQFWVTVDTQPIPLDVLIDGTVYPPVYSAWWNETEPHTINVTSPQPGGPGERWVWLDWSIGGPQEQVISVVAPFWVTARFSREFQVTVDTNPSGYPVIVNFVTYPTTPQVFWWPEATGQLLEALPYLDLSGTHRLAFVDWSDGDPSLVRPYDPLIPDDFIIANYAGDEYWVNVDTSPAGLDYWVDDAPYTTPSSWWWADASGHWLNTTPTQPGTPGTRYVFVDWTDGGPASNNVIITGPFDYVANFDTEFNVTIDTQPANEWFQADGVWYQAPQSFWWIASSVHNVLVNNTTPSGLNFTTWVEDGIPTGARTITPSSPATFTANYTAAPVPLTFTANANVTSGQAPLSVQFNLSASGGNGIYVFAWDFRDGSPIDTTQTPIHVFGAPGTYVVTVWVNDTGGETAPAQVITITVLAAPPEIDTCAITPSSATVQVGNNQPFTVKGYNGSVELTPLTIVWSVSPGTLGTITLMGLFTAGGSAGSGTVDASVTYASKTVTCASAVTVSLTPPPSVLITSPASDGQLVSSSPLTVGGTSANATSVDVRVEGGAWMTAIGVNPWSISLDLSSFPNGNILIEAIGRNATSGLNSTVFPRTVNLQLPVNNPPAADAGLDQTGVFRNSLVTLNGTGSSDPDLDTLNYTWTQTSGPSVTLTGEFTTAPTFSPTLPGTYVFELTVSDGSLNDTDTVSVDVLNRVPVADAGLAQTGRFRNALVTLDGSASSDPDLDTLTYAWTQTSGPTVTLAGAATAAPSFTPALAGTYVFQVSVSDGLLFDNATVSIGVVNRAPTVVMNPTNSAVSGLRGTPINLMVVGTDLDLDTLIYTWTVNGLPQSSTSDSLTFPATDVGVFYVNVTVSDGTVTVPAAWVVTITLTGTQQPTEIPWLIIGVVLAIIVAAILLLLFLMKRRKKPAEDVPPGSAPGQWTEPTQPTTMPTEPSETPQEWGSPAAAPAAVPAAAPAIAPVAPPATSPQDPMAQLAKLRELKDKGLLSDQEYETKRKQLLEKL